MHKAFYASGFLFHLPTKQILLQQTENNGEHQSWSLIETKCLSKEDAESVFQKTVYKLLDIKLPMSSIYPVYTYFHEELRRENKIIYGEVSKIQDFSTTKSVKFSWFSLAQVNKLKILNQAKHDLTIAQRVISSRIRKSLGLQTLE